MLATRPLSNKPRPYWLLGREGQRSFCKKPSSSSSSYCHYPSSSMPLVHAKSLARGKTSSSAQSKPATPSKRKFFFRSSTSKSSTAASRSGSPTPSVSSTAPRTPVPDPSSVESQPAQQSPPHLELPPAAPAIVLEFSTDSAPKTPVLTKPEDPEPAPLLTAVPVEETTPPPPTMSLRKIHPSHMHGTADVLRTKVVCTIGPATSGYDNLGRLVESGMNVCRLNLSHCTHDFAAQVIRDLRKYIDDTNHTAEVAVWIDINGPKVRTGRLQEPTVFLKAGDDFQFVNDDSIIGDSTRVSTTYTKELVKVGDKMYVDDGLLSFTGINFPSYVIDELPAISAKDEADIQFALSQDVDFVSVSCIRDVEDVEEARLLLGNSKVRLLAKIENAHGMDNFESILKLADGVVIDRGYLGAEIDIEEVTMVQKRMIARMLESMKDHPRPTRSEAADVANAVMDGADGLILSAETAVGSYVFETLDTMRRVAFTAELNTNYAEFQTKMNRSIPKPIGVSEAIASSAVLAARQVNATIIVCFTEYGGTARLVAKYRPQIPVLAATMVKQTARQMSITFGLVAYHHTGHPDDVIKETIKYAVSLGLCSPGEIAVMTSGQAVGFLEGTTTKMQLYTIPSFD
ncbi:Pyruvate/Phosphoenolpyruvate kinase-like domain-containing protein [Zopfochytrium polystomum]|nr:Pyruvate/Phosphoenolpyruvate kinase-like domain-containing protein [Zopfochytrium polystomum]